LNNFFNLLVLLILWYGQRWGKLWWQRQGLVRLQVTTSKDYVWVTPIVLQCAKLRVFLEDTAKASVRDAFALNLVKKFENIPMRDHGFDPIL